MKKRISIVLALGLMLLLVGCSSRTDPALKGFYQSTMKNGYHVQFSFQSDENTFVGYINNIEINKGTYEALGDRNYVLKGDVEELKVKLERDDSFILGMEKLDEKLNEGNPIQLKNVHKTPTYFEQLFNEEYENDIKELLE